MAGFLLVNKVYSPQYVLWLLPLAVMARPRWRDLLIWQAGEVVYVAAVWLYLGGWLYGGIGQQAPAYDAAILVRMAAELFLMAVVVRDVLRPAHDPVGREAQVISTRSTSVAVWRTRTGTSSPMAGTAEPGRQEQHRDLHVRRLGEQPRLAVDGVRRAHEPGRVEAPAGQRAARARKEGLPVGASSPMPWAVPPETTRMVPARGADRPRYP